MTRIELAIELIDWFDVMKAQFSVIIGMKDETLASNIVNRIVSKHALRKKTYFLQKMQTFAANHYFTPIKGRICLNFLCKNWNMFLGLIYFFTKRDFHKVMLFSMIGLLFCKKFSIFMQI